MNEKLKTGTTTVGIVCRDGVVIAADKRATMGYLIANKNVTKLIKITDRIALTIAGGVGDAQMITKYLKAQMRLYEMRRRQKPTVKACATFLSNVLYGGKGGFFPYYVQMLLAGHDETGYHLFSIGPDGSSIGDEYISTGSGSVIAYGVLEDNFKDGIEVKEATSLCARAISAAIERDVYTGNGVDIIIIDKSGIKKLSPKEISNLFAKK
jgi:proteasome beta subunit